jgi:hypothetical protein
MAAEVMPEVTRLGVVPDVSVDLLSTPVERAQAAADARAQLAAGGAEAAAAAAAAVRPAVEGEGDVAVKGEGDVAMGDAEVGGAAAAGVVSTAVRAPPRPCCRVDVIAARVEMGMVPLLILD